MIIILIILGLFTNGINGFPEEGIDFNPRLLQKEVYIIFRDRNYMVSELPVDSDQASKLNGKFFNIRSGEKETIIAYVGRVNSCRTGGCSNQADPGTDLQNEYFDYFIIFDSLKKVKVVRIFNYEATHGQEVTIKRWLDQFAGFDGNKPLRIGKEIDTISGATISVSAIVADVNEKTSMLNNYK